MKQHERAVLENIIRSDDAKVTPADRLNALEQVAGSRTTRRQVAAPCPDTAPPRLRGRCQQPWGLKTAFHTWSAP
jgi:hypothetical protein